MSRNADCVVHMLREVDRLAAQLPHGAVFAGNVVSTFLAAFFQATGNGDHVVSAHGVLAHSGLVVLHGALPVQQERTKAEKRNRSQTGKGFCKACHRQFLLSLSIDAKPWRGVYWTFSQVAVHVRRMARMPRRSLSCLRRAGFT